MKITEKTENIFICDHPVVSHNLSILRDKNTSSELFRNTARRIAVFLLLKATENLPLISSKVKTPLVEADSQIINTETQIIVAPILRAGLVLSDPATEILPQAKIHHIGLYRDEETLKPVWYYNNLPKSVKNPENTFIYILDPMLATGGSAIEAIKLFVKMNIPQKNISFISLISAPEGINKVHSEFSEIKILSGCLDECLNSNGYILPGLGDAGDRAFNNL